MDFVGRHFAVDHHGDNRDLLLRGGGKLAICVLALEGAVGLGRGMRSSALLIFDAPKKSLGGISKIVILGQPAVLDTVEAVDSIVQFGRRLPVLAAWSTVS